MRYEHERAREHGRRTTTLLAEDASITTVAQDCRTAGLAFVNGLRGAWDKLDLAMWLTGPYARATRHVNEPAAPTPEGSKAVSIEPMRDVVEKVRVDIVDALTRASYEESAPSFLDAMVQRGLVRKTVDADGVVVWVPVARRDLRLSERVGSLFAADYLNAPDAYEELVVCRTCGCVVFDDVARRLRQCSAHRQRSGFYERVVLDETRRRGPGIVQARPSTVTLRAARDAGVH